MISMYIFPLYIYVYKSKTPYFFTLKMEKIFDCDVHQGDGTAEIFKGRSDVYTVSIHCEENFPFVKSVSNVDVGVSAGII